MEVGTGSSTLARPNGTKESLIKLSADVGHMRVKNKIAVIPFRSAALFSRIDGSWQCAISDIVN